MQESEKQIRYNLPTVLFNGIWSATYRRGISNGTVGVAKGDTDGTPLSRIRGDPSSLIAHICFLLINKEVMSASRRTVVSTKNWAVETGFRGGQIGRSATFWRHKKWKKTFASFWLFFFLLAVDESLSITNQHFPYDGKEREIDRHFFAIVMEDVGCHTLCSRIHLLFTLKLHLLNPI